MHLRPFLWTISGVTFAMLVNATAKHWAALKATDSPATFLVGLILPLSYTLPLTLPLAILAATLTAPMRLATLSFDGSPLPVSRVARPVLAWATVLAFLSLGWQAAILPRTNRLLRGVYATGSLRSALPPPGDREMSLTELQVAASRARASAATAKGEQRSAFLRKADAFQVEFHKKFAIAAGCALLAAFGLVVGRLTGGGYVLAVGGTTFAFMVYYVGLIAGEGLGNQGIIHPAVAMWSSDLLALLALSLIHI